MGAEVNVRVSGGAGQGVHTVSNLVSRVAAACGHHFHVTQDYMSRIRGGRNSQTIRIGTEPVRVGRDPADIHLFIDPVHVPDFLPRVAQGGLAIADIPAASPPLVAAPLREMAVSAGSPILVNVAGTGAVLRALGYPLEHAEALIARDFKGDFREKNTRALRLGAEWAEKNLPESAAARFRLPPSPASPRRPPVSRRRSLPPSASPSSSPP